MTHVSQLGNRRQVLLITCQVKVVGPDGTTSQVRALLDSSSSASFITERLTQRLRLSRHHYGTKVSGIGGHTTRLTPRGMVHFNVTRVGQRGKALNVEALVLPKITSDLPSHPVSFHSKWRHMHNFNFG